MTAKKRKSKHIFLKVVLVIVFILILVAIFFGITQKNNISAIVDASKYSKEDIQNQMNDTKTQVQNTLKEYSAPAIRDFTPQEEEQIRKGQLSTEDAVARILEESGVSPESVDDASVDNPTNSNNNSTASSSAGGSNGSNTSSNAGAGSGAVANDQQSNSPKGDTQNNSANEVSQVVSAYTVQLYKLKANYLGQIGNIIDEAKAARKSGASASSLASQYMGRLASIEEEADSQVYTKIDELRGRLTSLGADTSICETMKSSYEKEKSLKKAYYVSLYNEKK